MLYNRVDNAENDIHRDNRRQKKRYGKNAALRIGGNFFRKFYFVEYYSVRIFFKCEKEQRQHRRKLNPAPARTVKTFRKPADKRDQSDEGENADNDIF